MHIPLISEYKGGFIARRLVQTFLGGPRIILTFKTTFLATIVQSALFVLPWAVSQIFNVFIDHKDTDINIAMYIFGCIMGTIVFILHVINYIIQRETNVVSKIRKPNHLLEEDEIELSKFCGLETFRFIFQRKSNWFSIISYSLISAIMCAISFNYLRIFALNKWWNNHTLAASIHGFGWFTVCISHYSLIATSPPEPAIFANNGNSFIGTTFRPFYTCCFLGIHCIAWKHENWKEIDAYLHIVFILLPLFWMLGILPPQNALLIWVCEQILCLGFGGSSTAKNWWLILTLSFSISLMCLVHYLENWITISVISACVGYLLSVNLEPWIIHIMKVVFPCLHCKIAIDHDNLVGQAELPHTRLKDFLFHLAMITLAAIVAWSPHFIQMSSEALSIVWRVSGCLTLALLTTLWLFEQFQRAYFFRGAIRNYFYHSISELNDKKDKCITSHHMRMVFQLSDYYSILSNTAMLILKNHDVVRNNCNFLLKLQLFLTTIMEVHLKNTRMFEIDKHVMPFVMLFIISAFGERAFHKMSPLSSISIVRAFRLVWQYTENSYLDMSFVYIISETTTLLSDHSIPLTISLFMVGVIRHRLIDAWNKLYVIAVIVYTSVSNKKQRLKYSWILLGLDVIFLPFLLVFALLSVGLYAPLMSLFTLPIFLVGFPRPIKFWPDQVGKYVGDTLDSIYYQQMIPSLINGLQRALSVGSLGTICDGDFFLARFQDRLLWMLVLEKGFGYCKMSIKGLELQETSCHAVEALEIDKIFEQAFDKQPNNKNTSCINRNALHTLIPYSIIKIKTYSNACNVLTGVIHDTKMLIEIKQKFPKVLTWVLLSFVIVNNYKSKGKSQAGISNKHSKSEIATKNYIESEKKLSIIHKEFQNFETSNHSPNIPTLNETWADKIRPTSVFSSWQDDDDPLENGIGHFVSPVNSGPKKLNREQVLVKHTKMTLPGVLQDSDENQLKIDHSSRLEKLVNHESFSTSPLSLPKEWTSLPVDFSFYNLKCPYFSKQWLYKAVHFITKDEDNLKEKKDLLNESLAEMYENLVALCYHSLTLDNMFEPDTVHQIFIGIFPSSLLQERLVKCKELHQLVLTAYRYTVKLALDECLIGPISSDSELNEYLQDYSESWHIGIDGDKQWKIAVLNQCPNLFSIGFDEIRNVYTSHLLTLQQQPLYIGHLNSALVKSIWSSLCLELLYLTNDDEERYSIQAEPTILRNLTVQAADPPLGYPVYSSEPVTLSTLIL